MVLQPLHAGAANAGGWFLATPLRGRPDANRIAGITGTLVLNAVAFMLLLAPMSAPAPVAVVRDIPPPMEDWIRPKQKPVDPPPQIIKPKVDPVPVPRPAIARPVDLPTPVDVPVLVDQGIPVEVPPVDVAPPTATTVAPAATAEGSALTYVDAPAPAYPRTALLQGREGVVLLRVTVGADGRPTDVAIERGSGSRDFDEAARRQVLRRWTFQPAIVDGQPVPAVGLVPVEFKLQ